MTSELKDFVKKTEANYNALRKHLNLSIPSLLFLCGLLFTVKEKPTNEVKLKLCEELLAKNSSFNNFVKGGAKDMLLIEMVLNDDPKKYLDDVRSVFELFAPKKTASQEFYLVASMIIASSVKREEFKEVVKKARNIYHDIKKFPIFLDLRENVPYAALLAIQSEIEEENHECNNNEPSINDLIESFKDEVTSPLERKGIVFTLIGEKNKKELLNKALELRKTSLSRNLPIGNGNYQSASYGLLSKFDVSTEQILNDINEVEKLLQKFKYFGFWYFDKKNRRLFASYLVSSYYAYNKNALYQKNILTYVLGTQLILSLSLAIGLNFLTEND